MAIRRILVPLFGADQPGPDHPDRPALHTALMVARLFGAHVDALYRLFRLDSDDHLRRLPPAYLEGYYRQLEAASRAHGAQRDAAARRLFDEALARAGVPYHEEPATPGQPSAAWRAVEEPVPDPPPPGRVSRDR